MAILKGSASDEGFKRLSELETEYRTQRLADQLHAIASYPHLFDEFPYPVLINSAILKIADYFRNSNNILRYTILQVFKKSRHHLEKVVNVDEAIRRMSPMLQSNDPQARAITLRVLGCMATIVSDRIDVYHNIIHSLDSSEAMEVSAAIYAADMIGAQSQRFCAIISGKLAFMVRDAKTLLPLRRRLIRIFGHMFEDITLARLARKTCLDILGLNQDGEYTVAILRTLTKLASHSLVDVDQQISLLMQQAQDQSNSLPGIRRVALMCLGLLAEKSIEFNPEQIKAIYEIALESNDEKTVLRATATLSKIFRLTGSMTSISLMDSGAETVRKCVKATLQILDRSFSIFSSSPLSSPLASRSRLVVLECYTLLSVILSSYQPSSQLEFLDGADQTFKDALRTATKSMEQFLVRIWSQDSEQLGGRAQTRDAQAKFVLSSLVSLTLTEGSIIDDLLRTLLGWMDTFKGSVTLIAKALLHIARQRPKQVHGFQDTILSYLENHVNASDTETFTIVYRALLEFSTLTHVSVASSSAGVLESRVSLLLEQFGQVDMMEQYTRNHWELYNLARYSLQSGWSSLALVALRNQEKSLTSVSAALWVMVVQTVALIESSLQTAAVSESEGENYGRLDLYSQQQMYIKVMGYLEELEVHQVNRTFHLQFCSLRRSYLQTCQSTSGILHLLSTSLMAERQRQQYQTTSDALTAISTLVSDEVALYRCAEKFNRLAHQYTVLRDSIATERPSDPLASMETTVIGVSQAKALKKNQHSDEAIEVLQTMCLIIAYAIQRAASVIGNANASSIATESRSMQEDEDEVFDIDPLLIPLLYLCEPERHNQHLGETKPGRTFMDTFRASTLKTLSYINNHLRGADMDALEVN
ncbi:Integrator complex subunit 7 [Mortierella sp. GBA43]|nr:Integrator complex subunit 7 [Mortierella sp. GBA43]